MVKTESLVSPYHVCIKESGVRLCLRAYGFIFHMPPTQSFFSRGLYNNRFRTLFLSPLRCCTALSLFPIHLGVFLFASRKILPLQAPPINFSLFCHLSSLLQTWAFRSKCQDLHSPLAFYTPLGLPGDG